MIDISAELSGKPVKGVTSYCVPSYYNYKVSPLAIAKKLSKYCGDITFTQVCRGHNAKTAKKSLFAAAEIKEIKTILVVTGDKASPSDISIFDMIKAVDQKRFQVAASVSFTRKNEARRMEQKAAAGATIFYTQPVFPASSQKLPAILQQLPSNLLCSVRIGVLIPFSSEVCRKIAAAKPDFISDRSFITKLAAAEKKSPSEAYAATVELARQSISAALIIAKEINNARKSCKVAGIHLYGLNDRVFGKGGNSLKVPAEELLREILKQ